jgi:iron complex outermembrane recepter protein
MTRNVLNASSFVRTALVVAAGVTFFIAAGVRAQEVATAPQGAAPGAPPTAAGGAPAGAAGGPAEVERVIVTGSNIPTAEETGPNPVDTYRPQDIEKLGIRNATDLTTFLPQEAGGTVNLNIGNGGDGTVQLNLRGILPKETLVLIDGKRLANGSLGAAGTSGGVDANLIPFIMVDHIDILKDGASAVYGADAVTGVVNFFLVHKFRGLEIGGTYGNTNLGASNEMGEWEAWLKAGTGDDKTDIVVIADFWERTGGLFSRDRDISSNGNFDRFAAEGSLVDNRSGNFPGRVGGFRLNRPLFFGPGGDPIPGVNTPVPHSSTSPATSPFYITPLFGGNTGQGGNFHTFNFAAFTPALPPADRQSYYGSFTREICDKYLEVFADFKYVRSFFDASLAAVPFTPDPFHKPDGTALSATGFSVPIENAFNPFTRGNATWISPEGLAVPVRTGVRFRGINDTGPRSEKFTYWDQLFDVGLRGQMGEFGDYFKTWNWEAGFRYSRNEGQDISVGEVSQPGLREALLDTNPATAFDPFLNFHAHNTAAARARVYVNLHNSGEFELPLGYVTINGDLFSLPAGPVSFAVGGEYHGERFTRDRDALNTTFSTIGSVDGQSFKVNRDVWGMYEEVRVPFTSPTWNFPLFYSFEVDFAEREEWYSQNTSNVLPSSTLFPGVPTVHTRYNTQKPKVSVRWQPFDPKWIGGLTLRGSYTEAFHAPTLAELTPASSQNFPIVVDSRAANNPPGFTTEPQIEERILGNPRLKPETAYEWTYGAVYSPKWVPGLTLSADWWHIDLRQIVTTLGADTIIALNIPGEVFRSTPPPGIPGAVGPVSLVIDPNENLSGTIFEGLDFEGIYILESSQFGHGDFGRLTTTVNGTYLARADLQVRPESKRFGIAGEFLPTGFALTSSLPRWRSNFSLFWDGPADTWMAGIDAGAVVHFISQYNDDNLDFVGGKPQTPSQIPKGQPGAGTQSPLARKVREWITLDLLLSYTFNLPAPVAQQEVAGYAKDGGKNVKMKDGKDKNVMPVSTAEYNPCGWRAWLNGTTITLGMQNVTDEDPPFVAGSFENGYDESLTTIKGRFWYVGLKKRF